MTEREAITKFQGEHRWLSNFWPATVSMTTRVYDNAWESGSGSTVARTFRTAEAAYQASKFDGREWDRFAVLPGSQDGAREAKRMGKRRQHANVERKIECMRLVVAAKFSTANPGLVQALLDTDRLVIEEGNDWGDTFWGISPPGNGQGLNWLGRIIMDRRSFLISSGFRRSE